MDLINRIVLFLFLIASGLCWGYENEEIVLEKFFGFTQGESPINPKCIQLMQPSISESSEFGIIINSVIIDSCQNSNLAYEGRDFSASEEGEVSYLEDPNDPHSHFSYKVLGRTLNNIYVLFHDGYIGLYRLEEKNIRFDFSESNSKFV